VIIVKNLQHGTQLQDLQNLFSSFGHLGKVILPPSGVTALVEFEKLSSAAKAFEKIAYTKVEKKVVGFSSQRSCLSCLNFSRGLVRINNSISV
jgi:hypothetical protein